MTEESNAPVPFSQEEFDKASADSEAIMAILMASKPRIALLTLKMVFTETVTRCTEERNWEYVGEQFFKETVAHFRVVRDLIKENEEAAE